MKVDRFQSYTKFLDDASRETGDVSPAGTTAILTLEDGTMPHDTKADNQLRLERAIRTPEATRMRQRLLLATVPLPCVRRLPRSTVGIFATVHA